MEKDSEVMVNNPARVNSVVLRDTFMDYALFKGFFVAY